MKKFMRTRSSGPPQAPRPAPHNGHVKVNGNANGVDGPARRDDYHSTLSSRYWSESADGASGAGGGGVVEPWCDREFDATWRSLGDKRYGGADVVWMRPHELCSRPVFGSEARARHVRGEMSAGGLCGAAAALALTPRLLDRVAPRHSFRTPHYTGAFRFRMWVFGVWRDVVVDDRLPTRGGVLLASRCVRPDDFMLPLLEKAYAKLYGSYAAAAADVETGGASPTARALQDLTGGVVQSFSLSRQPRALTLHALQAAVPRATLAIATPSAKAGVLAGGAPLCVTGLARLRTATDGDAGCTLLRVRAAGGRVPWAGAWARDSPEWRALPAADRDLLAERTSHPDEFWMSFSDFSSLCERMELVHLGPDEWAAEPALRARRPWRAVLARRRWRTGYNAGGPPTATETCDANPQFRVRVPVSEAGGGGGRCHAVVAVAQAYMPGSERARTLHAIGFAVYEVGTGGRRVALAALRALDVTHESRAREVASFFTLPAGDYLLVPHTRRPHTDAAFLLRVYTDAHTDVWEVNEDNAILRDPATEYLDERHPYDADDTESVDGARWAAAISTRRHAWCGAGATTPVDALSRALLATRDTALRGRATMQHAAASKHALEVWRAALGPGRVSSYRARDALRACGVSVSNKVLEALVGRFARETRIATRDLLLALALLHLAHERYRSLEAKSKANPISLEEIILMTIFT